MSEPSNTVIGKCGECTACCTVSAVKALDKKVWETCTHCSNNSCSIYGDHPDQCKEFKCAYLQSKTDNILLRPDKCGIMFVKKNDRIFTGMIVPNTPMTDTAKKQVVSFYRQGYSVVLLTKDEEPVLMTAPGHNGNEIREEYIKLLTYGNL
jgi:hypothetical protein